MKRDGTWTSLDYLRFWACPERGLPMPYRPWYRGDLPQAPQPFAKHHNDGRIT